jgi:hypothetical protein
MLRVSNRLVRALVANVRLKPRVRRQVDDRCRRQRFQSANGKAQ